MQKVKLILNSGNMAIIIFFLLANVGFAQETHGEVALIIEQARENIKKVDEELGVGVVKEEHFEEEIYVQQKEELVEEAQGDIEKVQELLILLPGEI